MTRFAVISILIMAMGVNAGKNLLPNGNFDAGKDKPDNWEAADGLTSFWIYEKGRGRILKLDSRISRKQALEWWSVRKKNPAAKPPKPIIPKKTLAAVGAMEGVMIDSGFIKVKPGQNYKLSVDYKGRHKPFVWIKGFFRHPRRNYDCDCYQTRLVPEDGEPDKWKSFSIGFNPTSRIKRTDKMKVRIYAYWPVGVYYFDNVRIEEITPEEMKVLVKKRSEVKKPDNKKAASKN
jgi:hypothetical protein